MNTSKPTHIEIKEVALLTIQNDIEILSSCYRLCSPAAEAIMVKYNLKGTLPIQQLSELILRIERQATSNVLTNEIYGWSVRRSEYNRKRRTDPYTVAVIEAMKENDYRKVNVMEQRQRRRENKLHDKKECICFTSQEI